MIINENTKQVTLNEDEAIIFGWTMQGAVNGLKNKVQEGGELNEIEQEILTAANQLVEGLEDTGIL